MKLLERDISYMCIYIFMYTHTSVIQSGLNNIQLVLNCKIASTFKILNSQTFPVSLQALDIVSSVSKLFGVRHLFSSTSQYLKHRRENVCLSKLHLSLSEK